MKRSAAPATKPAGLREHPWPLVEFARQYAWHLYARHVRNDWLLIHDVRPEGSDVY